MSTVISKTILEFQYIERLLWLPVTHSGRKWLFAQKSIVKDSNNFMIWGLMELFLDWCQFCSKGYWIVELLDYFPSYTFLDIIVVRKTSSLVSSAFYLCSDEWWWCDQCPRWRKDARGHHRPQIGHDSCQNIFWNTPPWPIFDNIGWNICPCAISSLYRSSFSG